jgi:hypothetical protein
MSYIDREAALEAIGAIVFNDDEFSGEESDSECFYRGKAKAEARIEKLPAADVAPIVHGEWLAWETEENVFECPFCHKAIQLMVGTPADNEYRHCPGCGAKLHALYEKKEVTP